MTRKTQSSPRSPRPAVLLALGIAFVAVPVVLGTIVSCMGREGPVLQPAALAPPEPPSTAARAAGDGGAARSRPPEDAPARRVGDEARARTFFRGTLEQERRLERAIGDGTGGQRFAHGALAALHLASLEETDPNARQKLSETARGLTRRALRVCAGDWSSASCSRGLLVLQRLGFEFPDLLGDETVARLRRELPAPAPVPTDGPWGFRETENQRLVVLASSLGRLALDRRAAPGGRLPPGRTEMLDGWADYAARFLTARDHHGWYEQDSPGYLAISIEALLHLADFAPAERVRDLARRQLDLLFADWAQNQVRGFPAGAKTRTYQHWALSPENTPWQAWYWWLTGEGGPAGELNLLDGVMLPAADYRVPETVARLAASRDERPPYEVTERRAIQLGSRRDVDAAVYSRVTADYVLSAAQAVDGLALGVSGGQEIMATLYADCARFAPVYLWSRTQSPRNKRWQTWTETDRAAASGPVALASLGRGARRGHAYMAPAWGRPEPLGDATVTARCGQVYVAVTAPGGFELERAQKRFAAFYGKDPALADAWVAVPRRGAAPIALEVGSAREDGSYEGFRRAVRTKARLSIDAAPPSAGADARGEPPTTVVYRSRTGTELRFTPGERLTVDGRAIEARAYPLLSGPFLASEPDAPGAWRFQLGDTRYRFAPLPR